MRGFRLVYAFHIHASVFFLPLALLFATTGVAFLLGYNPNSGARITQWEIPKIPEPKERLGFLLNFIQQKHLPRPADLKPRIHRGVLSIGTPRYEVGLEVRSGRAVISSVHRNFLGVLMVAHKGKAGVVLKILGAAFGVFLLLFYASGLIVGLSYRHKSARGIVSAFLLGLAVLLGSLWFY